MAVSLVSSIPRMVPRSMRRPGSQSPKMVRLSTYCDTNSPKANVLTASVSPPRRRAG
jgi:hypothetical protein